MTVIVNKQLVSDPLRLDNKSLRAKRTQPDDLADHPLARNFYGSQPPLSLLRENLKRRSPGRQTKSSGDTRALQE